MEFKVEGRRPISTLLESVEADMAELEIDRKDVHDRKKWRKNVMKRKSTPYRKMDKPIIYNELYSEYNIWLQLRYS